MVKRDGTDVATYVKLSISQVSEISAKTSSVMSTLHLPLTKFLITFLSALVFKLPDLLISTSYLESMRIFEISQSTL